MTATGTAPDETPASEDPDGELARTAREAALSVEQGIDELREAYARVALALDRARAATAGSAHPLPARALHGWADALELTGQAQAWLGAGVGELRRVPGVRPIGTAGDLVTALNRTIHGAGRTSIRLIQVRAQIDSATEQLEKASNSTDPAIGAALERWRRGIGVLDELTARVQHGTAALSAYANGVAGVDPLTPRRQRVADLLVRTRRPAECVGTGAELAGWLLDRAGYRQHDPQAAHLQVPFARRANWRSWRGFWASGSRRAGPWTDAAFYGDCLVTILKLCEGNTYWYADRIALLRRAKVMEGYADALTAAVVLAVERRFTPTRPAATVRGVADRLANRYNGDSGEIDRVAAEQLIQAALGEHEPPAVDTVTLTVLQTLLLVDLLVDERLTGAERAGFRAEAVELALSVEPGRLPAGDGVVERDCDG